PENPDYPTNQTPVTPVPAPPGTIDAGTGATTTFLPGDSFPGAPAQTTIGTGHIGMQPVPGGKTTDDVLPPGFTPIPNPATVNGAKPNPFAWPSPATAIDASNPGGYATTQVAGNHSPYAGYYTNVPEADRRVNQLIQSYIAAHGLSANQNDPTALNAITAYLRSQGVDSQTDYTDINGHTGGIVVGGH